MIEVQESTLSEKTEWLHQQIVQHEHSFLNLGTSLQLCVAQAQQLDQRIESVLNDLHQKGGPELWNQLDQAMNDSMEALQSILRSMQKGRATLLHTIAGLNNIAKKSAALESTADYFHALALNMRIQAAGVPGGDKLFEPMVISTIQLSKDIRKKNLDLSGLMYQSSQRAQEAIQLMESEEPKLISLLDEHSKRRALVGDQFQLMNQRVEQGSQELIQRKVLFNRHLSDVVITLQLHDHLRQRVEHISTLYNPEFYGLEGSLDSEWIHGLCYAQLSDEYLYYNQTIAQTEQALLGITEYLDHSVDILTHATHRHNGGLSEHLNTLLQSMNHTQSTLDRSSHVSQEVCGLLQNFKSISTQIADHLKTILEWKVDSKLLSINSILMAGQLGHAGVALTAISQEIVTTSESLSQIVENLKGSTLKLESNCEEQNQNFKLSSLQGAQEMAQQILDSIQNASTFINDPAFSSIRNEISHSSQNLKGIRLLGESVQSVLQIMTPAHGAPPLEPSDSAWIHPIQKLYTMEEERKILALYYNLEYNTDNHDPISSEDDSNIELF